MTIDDILRRFRTFDGHFPEDAFREAVAQREAITPALLGLLSTAADDPAAAAEDPDDLALTYALFLLAEFREPRAFRPCIALASLPAEQAFELLSELIDDSLDRILVSVFDGDTAPLVALAANGRAEEGIRAAAVRALVALGRHGRIPSEECAGCLRELMNGKIPDTAAWVWDELVLGVIDLPAPELRDEADHAVQEGFTSEDYEDLDELEEAVKRMPADPPEPIESAAADLRSWYCFTAEGRAEMESESDAAEGDWEPAPDAPAPVPYVAPPTPGRNDPCPCGSGKKYKKCCGA